MPHVSWPSNTLTAGKENVAPTVALTSVGAATSPRALNIRRASPYLTCSSDRSPILMPLQIRCVPQECT
jgi:hypothetical protein